MADERIGTKYPKLVQLLQAPFGPQDLEWLPKTFTRDGDRALALAYVTARALQNRLDRVLGPENWWPEYKPWGKGEEAVLCGLTLRFPGGEVVTKWNAADETHIEGTKGGISASMKRVGTGDWGMGRQLYDLPTQWLDCHTYRKGEKYALDTSKGHHGWVKEPPLPDWYVREYDEARKVFRELYHTSDAPPKPPEKPASIPIAPQGNTTTASRPAVPSGPVPRERIQFLIGVMRRGLELFGSVGANAEVLCQVVNTAAKRVVAPGLERADLTREEYEAIVERLKLWDADMGKKRDEKEGPAWRGPARASAPKEPAPKDDVPEAAEYEGNPAEEEADAAAEAWAASRQAAEEEAARSAL